jgi:hypothetical protein
VAWYLDGRCPLRGYKLNYGTAGTCTAENIKYTGDEGHIKDDWC